MCPRPSHIGWVTRLRSRQVVSKRREMVRSMCDTMLREMEMELSEDAIRWVALLALRVGTRAIALQVVPMPSQHA